MLKTNTMTMALAAMLTLIPFTMSAQKEFTLEDLNFGGTNYSKMTPENRFLTWWGDELVRLDSDHCAIVDKKTGKETTLFTLEEIAPLTKSDEHNRMRHLYNASFPYPGKTQVLLINGKERMLLDWRSGDLVKYNRDKVQAEDLNYTSLYMAYVKGDNLFVADSKGNSEQITTDGSREIVYGQSVHRDEFGISGGLFWSPNGTKLAFYRMDQSMVTDYPQVNIFARTAEYAPDKYPMAGDTSHKVTVGIYDTATKQVTYLNAGDPTDRYFTNIAWGPDNQTVYMFELNRDQNDCRLTAYIAETGEKKAELLREQHAKYVEPLHPIMFLPWDSNKFLFQSQMDGYNHLYLFDLKKGGFKQITQGQWVVMEVLGFNKKAQSVIIASNESSPIQRNLYAVNLKNGKRTLLDNGRGYHSGVLSATGEWAYDKYSEPDVPRNIDVLSTVSTKKTQLLCAADPWKGYNVPEYSCGSIKAADGTTDLYYRMVKPIGFDPSKKYPTVIYVYGGPHAHNVDARWHYCSRSWETYMAQKGYLLFILDNRGSENRGRDFEQATFRQLGQVEMQDQMKGVEFLQSLPYVDQERMGVHGWSFGGFMTITLMTNHPDVFKVGVAGGPVIDWKWYEVMYGERYMDTPQANPEGYAKSSLLQKAKDLKGKLQIITGYNDPTVVPQHCLSFIAECIKAGTQPDFFAYPGEPHNMRGHQSVHLHERITQYFEDYLK
ncbi:MAG: DPP IV N-terminal domain-containing protein [Prevotella sp.]|nr:DPP IV N-terminal domain-containing protein [Prevotella sp.]